MNNNGQLNNKFEFKVDIEYRLMIIVMYIKQQKLF